MNRSEQQLQQRIRALEAKIRFASRAGIGLLMASIVGSSTIGLAAGGRSVLGLHIFEAGQPAVAAEVNENFELLAEGVMLAAPPGVVVAFAGAAVPNGWLLCNGQVVAQADYPELYAAIGTTWGTPEGASDFRLPDFGNQFLRGATEEYAVGGSQDFAMQNVTGRMEGLYVDSVNFAPEGAFQWANGRRGSEVNNGTADSSVDVDFSFEFAGANVADETRPMNKAVQYIIKY